MSFISYAQNFEDVMLWRALKNIDKGFYIDIGAAWPEIDSVTKSFYDMGWSGINVEPNPVHYDALASARPRDTNLKKAVSDKAGTLEISIFSDTGLSTLDETAASRHEGAGWYAQKQKVQTVTLKEICEEYVLMGQQIHFLKVDVEGAELQVLQGNDWERFRPWVVVLEATLPLSQVENYQEWESLLLGVGYVFAYADGLNRFYLASEHQEMITAFKYPPNVFDDYRLVGVVQAETRVNQAEVRASEALASLRETEMQVAKMRLDMTALYNSKSWRITKPLRLGGQAAQRVKKWLKSRAKGAIRFLLTQSRLKVAVKKVLAHHPVLNVKVRKLVAIATSEVLGREVEPQYADRRMSLPLAVLLEQQNPVSFSKARGLDGNIKESILENVRLPLGLSPAEVFSELKSQVDAALEAVPFQTTRGIGGEGDDGKK